MFLGSQNNFYRLSEWLLRDFSTSPDKETVRITRCAVGMNEQILNDFLNTIRNPQAMPVFCKFSKLLSGILSFYEKKVFKKISLFFKFPCIFLQKIQKKFDLSCVEELQRLRRGCWLLCGYKLPDDCTVKILFFWRCYPSFSIAVSQSEFKPSSFFETASISVWTCFAFAPLE